MGYSELHTRKFKKNIAVMGLIFGFIAIIMAVTMIRISANITANPPHEQTIPAAQNPVE
jgi:hypothetical protein